jgi:hypothetical protein
MGNAASEVMPQIEARAGISYYVRLVSKVEIPPKQQLTFS